MEVCGKNGQVVIFTMYFYGIYNMNTLQGLFTETTEDVLIYVIVIRCYDVISIHLSHKENTSASTLPDVLTPSCQ